jgi:hypothetical protein
VRTSGTLCPTKLVALGSAVLVGSASACGSTSSSSSQWIAGGSGATSSIGSDRTGLADGGSAAGGSTVEGDGASSAAGDAAGRVEGDGASSAAGDAAGRVEDEGASSAASDGAGGATGNGRLDGAGEGPASPAATGSEDAAPGVFDGPGDTSSGGEASGDAIAPPTAFTCNLLIGNSTTQQWFDGGFLTYSGIDPTHWELYWVAHHYIDLWANPDDAGWATPFDMGHTCATDSATPDRVIFIVTYAPPYPTEATYQANTTSVVDNIIAKYPTVKRIELMTLIRSPGNVGTCSSQPNNEQSIPAQEDQAIAAVAANPAFAGLAFALPPFYVPSCSDFVANAPQYTTAGATDIANVYGAYYAARP